MNPNFNKLAAIVLAAASSRRLGTARELHAELPPQANAVTEVLQRVAEFPFAEKLVVIHPDNRNLALLATEHSFVSLPNQAVEQGIGTSIACAFSNLDQTAFEGAVVFLGDLPFIQTDTIDQLISNFTGNNHQFITRPAYSDLAGHPVIFPACFFSQLSEINGDEGANRLIRENRNLLALVETEDIGVVRDIAPCADPQA